MPSSVVPLSIVLSLIEEGSEIYPLEYFNMSNFTVGEVEERQKERTQKEAKDSRNLYLAREGIIREGTKVSTPAN